MNIEENTSFHCCAEWHLAKLSSPSAAFVYPFALRISKNSGKFACSATSVGAFFGKHRTTILRAYHELTNVGLFELLEYGKFDVNIYKVLKHDAWALKHPGLCTRKVEFPWTGEGDALGQNLWAASGCRVKFKEFQVAACRKTGLREETIVSLFTEWLEGVGKFRRSRNVPFHFLMFLKTAREDQVVEQGVLSA